jgi:hypothetical protein
MMREIIELLQVEPFGLQLANHAVNERVNVIEVLSGS